MTIDDPEALAARVVAGEPAAVAEALNRVDDARADRRESQLALLDALEPRARGARIGVTGAPGAGKSTLLDALVSELRRRGRTVGILAVDPSSQRTGGALLGDRMRLGSIARDAGVFLRSLAARDRLGGLSEATGPSLDVLAAAFDVVFVETVGVGQSESEVTDLVDTLVFVAQPAAGDLIQFMKAGILEWPDVFFVNKSDLGELATRTAAELRAGLELGARRDATHRPPVLCGSGRDGIGIEALVDAIDAHRDHLARSGEGEARRRASRVARVRRAIATEYGRQGLRMLQGELAPETFVAARDATSVARLVDALRSEIEVALRRRFGGR
ncbi:MAG: methylmalonyl Co-A mutase-associated GTPase MeaB [Myxococcota bacterium]|nr:methylmalonyl Co-A mutase-associated GTPase MeaB [Myxococcales bacterium]